MRKAYDRRGLAILLKVAVVLFVLGLVLIEDNNHLLGYLAVTLCALLPSFLWLYFGAPGMPILPVAAALYYVYYALPLVRNNIALFESSETLQANLSVAGFLLAATAAWCLVCRRPPRVPRPEENGRLSQAALGRILFIGLTLSLIFQITVVSGATTIFGSYFGIVRSVALVATIIACYTLGNLCGKGTLRGEKLFWAIVMLLAIVVLFLASLFLVFVIVCALTTICGYVFEARRIPWRSCTACLFVLFVLHSGKPEMRMKYWAEDASSAVPGISIAGLPAFLLEWGAAGIASISVAAMGGQRNLIDRASLLDLLTRVQILTPRLIPYFDGESYARLPELFVPRFLDEGKAVSQVGMKLLNVRYLFQTDEQAEKTAIGWGLIAEAYANFGVEGVAAVGGIFGLLTGLFMRISTGASGLSLRSLIGIVSMMTLVNPEVDLSYMLINLWQACIAVTLFYLVLRILPSGAPARALPRPRYSAGMPPNRGIPLDRRPSPD